ncbi:hypothetical protein F5050DRAFT_1719354 [Lentinula boryana]|uniref:Uncharacterized protein n=1 Tax=Lentinula boryana TaxID=40481 RepID=A0ABQ8QU92_9AGAR|nr:hypothetical protein F5050DRAFT_1719354 [Lentinula boryana]
MLSRLSRRSSSPQPIYDSFEPMPNSRRTNESTKTVHRLSQLVRKSRTLLSFIWLKDTNNQGQNSCPQSVNERINRQRSSSVLDLMQPRPSLPTDRISRPYRPGSYPFSRNSQQSPHSHSHLHSHSYPHGRQISRSEVTVCSRPSRPTSQHPPRFASVVRRKAPRYSTIARPTHSTVFLSSEMDNGESLAVVNFGGMTALDSPPPYSQFDLGTPRTGYVE